MDFELRRAREKLDKEQKERKERARLKLERERKAREEASKQREAIEASQRSRRLDAAQAQLKADQENQENLLRGRGVSFYRLLEALPYNGSGDKIKLPPSCFTELADQRAFDNGPLYFQLSVLQGGSRPGEDGRRTTTHAGVLEFTADEGSVCLPPHLWLNLFGPVTATDTTQTIEVQYVWLQKGTYAKLRADTPGFSDLPNHKAVLETSLRQHATLSLDDVFVVNYGELQYKIRVLELRPSASVSVLETDLEVDIEDSGDKTEQRVLRPLVLEKSESGFVAEGSYAYFKFSIDDKVHERVNSGAARVEIRIEEEEKEEAEPDLGDTDIYVSKHPMIFPTQHQHQWSCHDIGSKSLFIGSKDKNFSPGTYSIGIYGFKGKTRFNLTIKVQDVNNGAAGQQISSSSSSSAAMEVEMDMVECKNCKRHVPSRTKVLHEAYCSRHNVVCEHVGCGVVLRTKEAEDHVHCDKCGQAFHRAELDKHKKVFHDPVRCPCGVVLEKEDMVRHQNSSCPLRLIVCRFCGDMVTAGSSTNDARDRMRGLSEHESLCGSRTAPCDSCGRSVMLKDMDIHQIAVHQKN